MTPNPGEVVYVFYSGRDQLGRQHFAILWHSPSRPLYDTAPGREHICIGHGPGVHGQHFFTNPTPYQERDRKAGLTIIEERTRP